MKPIKRFTSPLLTQPRGLRIVLGQMLVAIFLIVATTSGRTQNPMTTALPSGVLRLRVRVKSDDSTKGLSRKRFFLLRGTLEQNTSWIEEATQQLLLPRDCYYRKLGASQALIDWLKEGDCESVYCREIEQDSIVGTKAVPEFAMAFAAGEKEFGNSEIARKWLVTNIPSKLREGFYLDRRSAIQALLKQAEALSGSQVISVMTDRNGTAYFTDLEPGSYVLSNLLPFELGQRTLSWNCDVLVKPGDIATEKPYLVSNTKDRTVKCVAAEKPLPVCEK